jgi:hypothetical protein
LLTAGVICGSGLLLRTQTIEPIPLGAKSWFDLCNQTPADVYVGKVMRRRDFITLSSAFFAVPFQAHAQEHGRPRRIAIMIAPAEGDPQGQARVMAFREKLQELGWTDGRNIQIDYRWGAGPDRAPNYAEELVRLVSVAKCLN